jgi:hypothetical protein
VPSRVSNSTSSLALTNSLALCQRLHICRNALSSTLKVFNLLKQFPSLCSRRQTTSLRFLAIKARCNTFQGVPLRLDVNKSDHDGLDDKPGNVAQIVFPLDSRQYHRIDVDGEESSCGDRQRHDCKVSRSQVEGTYFDDGARG